jgi:Flp pilus assembly protein TadG
VTELATGRDVAITPGERNVISLPVRRSHNRHRSRGQAIAEFTLVIPLLLLLVAGMVDLGVGLDRYMTVVNTIRDGARLGANLCGTATPACSSVVRTRVTAAGTAAGVTLPSPSVACTAPAGGSTPCDSGGAKGGGSVTVSVTYTYQMIWPLAFGASIPMSYSAKFMVQ